MDDLKLYGKNMQKTDSLLQTVRIFSNDIVMQFGISMSAMLEIQKGNYIQCEGIELTKWRNN